LLRNRSVCFGCFDIGSKHRNKPKFFLFGFTKQTETNAKQILFRFVSVRTEIYFCLFRGHPTRELLTSLTIPQSTRHTSASPRNNYITAFILSFLDTHSTYPFHPDFLFLRIVE
jgi:hypothetical protein